MDGQQKIVTAALLLVLAMIFTSVDAFAGEIGSHEPDYNGPNQDIPFDDGKTEPGVGPGVPTVGHNVQVGQWATENHIEESIDLPHASDTNI